MLKQTCRVFALLLLLAVVPTGVTRAQTPAPADFPNATIGVMDLQRIMGEVTVGSSIQAEYDRYLQKYQTEAMTEERALQQEAQKVMGGKDQTSEAAVKRRQEFERKVNAFRMGVSQRLGKLDRALSLAQGEVYKVIIEKSQEVALERAINLVLYKHQTLLFDPRMELTDEVLKRVNASLTSVTFTDPETLPDVPGK
ncbi:OmpH family outer membrane protein [Phaeovibrio sulfidiphilus]|uniref:OmpH family outer membrane protein n=1 Tax=Phaeovibrio sulfidiphilus TaxID=1220600 RepID=A0A8J7CQK3_9PROT|nr:OmpH family outer membrane protein [Phaeovibrio sulfidiphilus]MBE1236915.1 OmpH family outer membrane protein [Phaeovibrio sulfidiphilus]